MAEPEDNLVPLLAALRDLVAWLQDAPTPGTGIGGVAASLLGRPRDMADIEAILDAQPQLDLPRVRRWVREFSATLEAPELLRDLNALVTRRRKREKPPARRRPKG